MAKTKNKSDEIPNIPGFSGSLVLDFGSNIASYLYYPYDQTTMLRVAAFLFNSLPSTSQFPTIRLTKIFNVLSEFGFQEFNRDESLDKKADKTDILFYSFINSDLKTLLMLTVGGEEVYNTKVDSREIRTSNVLADVFGDRYRGESEENDIANNLNLEKIGEVLIFFVRDVNNKKQCQFLEKIRKAAEEKLKPIIKKNHINFLCYENYFKLKNVKLGKKMDIDLELNYGKDFKAINDHLVQFLNSNDSGLCILNGKPGTGKSTYIKYLLSILNKKVIYIPPHLINRVAEPDFLNFLLSQNDFILVLEDAEPVVTDRKDGNNSSGVSNLLNLSDGILGDCINSRIITTFNTEITNIDPALLRNGRLKLQYEFSALSIEDSNKLLKHLGIDYETKEKMILSDIYNKNYNNFRKETIVKPIGFGGLKV